MPRSRVSEGPQRQSTRAPSQLRTSSSDSDPLHHRPTTDRSPKLGGNRRSPRGTQSDPLNQKKLGTRIADLESQLGQAQEELKCLKDQLSSAEAAKKAAQDQLEKKTKKRNAIKAAKRSPPNVSNKKDNICTPTCEIVDEIENQQETDVFEVPVEPKVELSQPIVQDEPKIKAVDLSPAIAEPKKPSVDMELALKNDEIGLLKAKLEENEKEFELFRKENESLKCQLSEKFLEISSAREKEEEMSLRLNQVEHELETSKSSTVEVIKKLEATEKAKEELETEMKKLRVQTEQWRKAADAAAAVLAGGVEMNGRRLSERCGSMDKQHYGGSNLFEAPAVGYIGSPGLVDDSDDFYVSGKRKGSGIRMFGDLWKKKGQK